MNPQKQQGDRSQKTDRKEPGRQAQGGQQPQRHADQPRDEEDVELEDEDVEPGRGDEEDEEDDEATR